MAFEDLTSYQQISVYLFCIFSCYLVILTFFLIYRAKRAEQERKYYFISIAFFTCLYTLCRVLLIIDLILQIPPLSPFYIYGSFCAILGVAGLMIAVEKFVYHKFKYIPSIGVLIFAALVVLVPGTSDTKLVTYWVSMGTFFAILIPILYLKVGLKSVGEIRKNSFYIAFGILVFLIGNAMNMGLLTALYEIFFILAPITMLIGLILFQMGLK